MTMKADVKEQGSAARSGAEKTIQALTAAFGNRVVTSRAVREQHGNTVTWLPNQPPDAVVFPQSVEDVQQIVRICAANGTPVIPFGTGSSLEGHVNAPQGGVSIDFRDMNRVLAVHADDLDCVIEPGTNAVRYGTMKDNVLAMKVVLANGDIMTTAHRAKKTSAGYDLTRLMVGSEGTLGVIVELTLKLAGIPEAISGGVCPFPSVEACCKTTIQTIQTGIPIARIELLDALQVRAINLHSKLGLAETPMLFVEFHGTDASVAEQSTRFGEIAAEFGGGPFQWTTKQEERTRLWDARHHAAFSNFALRPGSQMIATDVCVPISRLADCVTQTQADIAESRLVAPIVGHVGDGNFHLTLLIDMNDPDEVKRAKALNQRLVERALSMDGTCTGEHGVGQGKMKYLEAEYGRPALAAMAAIKRALDPQDIMNPGKIVPLE
jgi:D-lactate dehydrogenase (cytochrome)